MNTIRYASKVVYYGGYPGSSGKPIPGRLSLRDGVLRFEPRDASAVPLQFERSRLLDVRRSEEGLTGGRRIRLLVDVETENTTPATLKFEMGGLLPKGRKLARWLEALRAVCPSRKADNARP